jgi:signal transduction histidine kinase
VAPNITALAFPRSQPRPVGWLDGRRRERAGDAVLVALLAVAPLVWAWSRPGSRPAWVQAAVYGILVLPLWWRRRYPRIVAATVVAVAWTAFLARVWGNELPLGILALDVVVYTLVTVGRRRAAWVAATASIGLDLTVSLNWTPAELNHPDTGWFLVGNALMLFTAWTLAELKIFREDHHEDILRRAILADAERTALARVAVAEERNRVSRELHDILAHNLSVIVVNAEGAKLMRHTDPSVVDRTLTIISATGRSALAELRRMLEIPYEDWQGVPAEPTQADLHHLVSQASSNRPPIRLTITGVEEGLTSNALAQTYRIIQEALTNVIKHAPPNAETGVVVDYSTPRPARFVAIEVINSGGIAERVDKLPSSGRGLAGMRERVAIFGGTVEAGRTPDGGYRLCVRLPVPDPLTQPAPHPPLAAAPPTPTAALS